MDNETETVRNFAGNGIKSGLNSMVAIEWAIKDKPHRDRIAYLKQPFQPGIKKTFYTYYVDKKQLSPGCEFREKLEFAISKEFKKVFANSYQLEQVRFSEEPGLIYFKVLDDKKMVGAVFIRNSGTEDKSALYLRGESQIDAYLDQVGFQLHMHLLKGMKNADSEFVTAEKQILNAIESGQDTETIKNVFPSLPIDRMMKEIEFKEGLIEQDGKVLKLTEKGRMLKNHWETHEKS